MGGIYPQAAFANIWLGCGDTNTEVLIDPIAKKGVEGELLREVLKNDLWEGQSYSNYDLSVGARRLHSCKYWSRLCIMQECVVARHPFLRYGTSILDSDNLNAFGPTVPSSENRSSRMTRMLALRYEYGTGRKLSLGDILFMNKRHTQCEGRRDQIYAVLGLARDGGSFNIDYDELVDDLFLRALKLAERSRDSSLRTIKPLFDARERSLRIPGSILEAHIRDRYHLKVKVKEREGQSLRFLTGKDYRMLERAVKSSGAAHQLRTAGLRDRSHYMF